MKTYDELDEEQRKFWDEFPSQLLPNGEARRQLGLLRRERYFPIRGGADHPFEILAHRLTPELDDEKGFAFANELLADESKLIAYSAALRLRGV